MRFIKHTVSDTVFQCKSASHSLRKKIENPTKSIMGDEGHISAGLGPNNQNTLEKLSDSCQIFRLLKLLTNISDCNHMK
jgi:hypothetical protein